MSPFTTINAWQRKLSIFISIDFIDINMIHDVNIILCSYSIVCVLLSISKRVKTIENAIFTVT